MRQAHCQAERWPWERRQSWERRRVFDIKLQDRTVEKAFDLVKKTGGARRAFAAEYRGAAVSGELVVELETAAVETGAAHSRC
jgi:hypothetical protein